MPLPAKSDGTANISKISDVRCPKASAQPNRASGRNSAVINRKTPSVNESPGRAPVAR